MKLVKAESTVKKQYLFTAIILLLVIIPVYLVSYNITMKNISAGIRGSVDVTMNMVDNEIENLRKTSLNITAIPEYVSVNKYMVVDSPVEYAEVKNFTEKYTQMIGLSNIIKDTFIVLKRSDIVVSKKLVLCGEDFYDIDNFIRFGDIGLNELLDEASKSGLSEIWRYCPDTVYCGEKADTLAVCLSAGRKLNSDYESVIIGIIDINDVFEAMGINNMKKHVKYKVTSYDGSVLCQSEGFDLPGGNKISYDSNSSALKLDIKVNMSYYHSEMKFLHLLMLFYTMLIIAVGIGIVFSLMKIHNSKIRSLAVAIEEFTGIDNVKNDYAYLSEVVKGITNQNLYLDSVVTSNIVYRLFTTQLSDDEYEIIRSKYPDLFGKSIVVVVKSGDMMSEIVELGAKQYELEIITILRYYDGNVVAVIKACDEPEYYYNVVEKMQEFVARMKEKGIEMFVAVSKICESIEQIPENYRAAHNLLRHLEYKNIIVDSQDMTVIEKNIPGTLDKLYEQIMQGDEFGASCTVYEQWYNLSEGDYSDNGLEQLFFDQRNVLLRVAQKTGYNEPVVNYDSKLNIQEIAFSVTDCIKNMCDHLKNTHKEDKIYDEVIECILDNYTNTNFGMTYVMEKFRISDKTVSNIVRQKTGENFLTFVERLKIEKAKELLETSNLKIAEIATLSGYGTEGAFYKAFKKKMDVSPGVYRKNRNQKITP